MENSEPEFDTTPPSDPQSEAAIGRVVIAWGLLEQQIDWAIEDILRLDDDLAQSVTANLGTKAKIEIFQSAAHCLSEFLTPVPIETIDTLINDTAGVAGKYRNLLAHGQPWPVVIEDAPPEIPKGPIWMWAKWSARKGGPKITATLLGERHWNHAATEINAVAQRWRDLRSDIKPGLRLYDRYRDDERRG